METKWNRKCVSSHSLFVSHFAFCSGLKHRCFVKFITLQPSNRLKSNRVHCWRDLLSAHADKQGVDIVVYCFVCVLFVRLRISPPRIKLAASNFARRFIGVQGRESHIFVNIAPPEAKNRTNRPARGPRPPGCKHYHRDAPT